MILRNLKNTSYSEKDPNNNSGIIAHIYYVRDKRGHIMDFLGSKWKPFLSNIAIDKWDICGTCNKDDQLAAEIEKLKNNKNEELLGTR